MPQSNAVCRLRGILMWSKADIPSGCWTQRAIMRPHIHQLCAPLPFIRMMVENNLRPESIRKRVKRRLRIQERRQTVRCDIHLIQELNIQMQTGHQLTILLDGPAGSVETKALLESPFVR